MTTILRNGVEIRDVADVLGHKDIETTKLLNERCFVVKKVNFLIQYINNVVIELGNFCTRRNNENFLEDVEAIENVKLLRNYLLEIKNRR